MSQSINVWLQMNNFPPSIEGELKKFNVENVNQIKSKSCLELMFMLEFIVQSDSFKNLSNLIIPFKSAIYNVHSNIKFPQDSKYSIGQQKQYGGYGGYGGGSSAYGGYAGYGGDRDTNQSAYGVGTNYNTYNSSYGSGSGSWSGNKSGNSSWGGNKSGGWSGNKSGGWSGNKSGGWGGNKWGGNKWSNQRYPQTNSDKTCWDFKTGNCQRGSTCQWAHSAAGNKKKWGGSAQSRWGSGGSWGGSRTGGSWGGSGASGGGQGQTKKCWDFISGRCARGNTCQWLHIAPSSNKKEYEAKRQGHAQKENKNKSDVIENEKPVIVEKKDNESDNEVINEMNVESKPTPGNDGNDVSTHEKKENEENKNDIDVEDEEENDENIINEDDENKERDSVSGLSNDDEEEEDDAKQKNADDANAESDEPCW